MALLTKEVMSGLKMYGRMIKFSHTVFALPFALAAVVLAGRTHPVTMTLVGWILLAMVSARSAAMGFNRIVDADIDAKNPRTARREIPAGALSKRAAIVFVLISSVVFVLSAAMINRLCFFLSVPALIILFVYSFTKRFTSFSHLYLGFAISLAPAGAWIAVSGQFDIRICLLSAALLTYIAGFDILYACQDIDFDRREKLFSVPARMGRVTAFHISGILHLLAACFFLSIYFVFDMGPVYVITVILILLLLIIEHRLVRPDNLDRIQMAFFHVNSAISIILFIGILLDDVVGRWS
jgi:4-hydroxybenzoate polyprenyltransferase